MVVCVAYASLVTTWLITTPAGGAADEEAHYARAAGISQGEIAGSEVAIARGRASESTYEWAQEVSRGFIVPASLAPPDFAGCFATHPDRPATCSSQLQAPNQSADLVTYVGTYPPFAYLPAALLMRFAADPWEALYIGRLGVAVVSISLVVLGLLTLLAGRVSALAFTGPIVALTPMAISLFGVLSSSGIEIASAFCFVAGLVRLRSVANDRAGSNLVPLAIGTGGFILGCSRPLGWLWSLALAAGLLLLGPPVGESHKLVRSQLPALMTGLVGATVGIGWSGATGQHLIGSPVTLVSELGVAAADIGRGLLEQVGWFGWVDTPLPAWAYAVWLAAFGPLLLLALRIGGWRHRIRLLAVVAIDLAALGALDLALMLPLGQHVQGRDALAIGVSIPVLCGEVVYEQRNSLTASLRQWLPVAVVALAVLVQIVSWYVFAHRNAVGASGPWDFAFVSRAWHPHLGWPLWMAVSVGAAALLFTAVVSSCESGRAAGGPSSR